MRFKRHLLGVSLVLFAIFVLAGCFSSGGGSGGGGGGGGSEPEVTELRIEPLLQTIPVGFTLQFEATAVFEDGSSREVTEETAWSSLAPEVADFGSAGALEGLSAGETGVTASFQGQNATAQIEVRAAQLQRIDVEPAGPLELAIGETRFLKATAVYEGDLSLDVTEEATWHSSDESQVSVDNDEFPGLVTGLGETVAPVDIQAAFDGETSSAVEISVTSAMLQSISVAAPAGEIKQGSIVQFTATARYSDQPDVDVDVTDQVVWSAEPPDLLEIRNDSGFHGKAAGQQAGSVTVTATMGGETDEVTVEVIAAPSEPRRLNLSALPNVIVNGSETTLRAEVTANNPEVAVADSLVKFSLIGGELDLGPEPEAQTVDGVAEIQATAIEPGLALVFAEVEGTLAQGFAWVMVVPSLADAVLTSYATEEGDYVFRAANLSNREFQLVSGDVGNGACQPSASQIGTVLQTGDRLVIRIPQDPVPPQPGCGMENPDNRIVVLTFRDLETSEEFDVTISEDD